MNRNINIDLLRLFSIYIIILVHASSAFMLYNSFNNGAEWWIISVTYNSFIKWATGVFIMISGVFMLQEHRSQNIKKFLWKRFTRIFVPFIVWAIIYKVVQDYQTFIDSKGMVLFTYLKDILNGKVESHLWFVYMIFVLYLLTPVFSYLVNHAPKHIIKYFIAIWLFANFIPPYFEKFLDIQLGFSSYLEFNLYSGLYILGYYLKDLKFDKKYLLIIAFLAIAFINLFGTYYLSHHYQKNDYFFLYRLNITNILNSIIVFVFFNNLNLFKNSNSKISNQLVKLSLLSYGIYLNHNLVLYFLRSGKFGFQINSYTWFGSYMDPKIGVPIVFFICIVLSSLLAIILNKIPYLNKITV